MSYLILVRHGKSSWNHLGIWTGQTDVDLAEEGFEEARQAGSVLNDIKIDCAYVSPLKRAQQTLDEMKVNLAQIDFPTNSHAALNERDYGVHTGKNKWEIKKEIGDEEFFKLRRGWDTPVPGGETLKDVHARVVPYYEENIKKDLLSGKNVLVVAHNNSLRALVKHLENLEDDKVCDVEIGTGEVHCYKFDEHGKFLDKEVRLANKNKMSV